ncbi:hypothetical protein N7G274_003818 [Stereocaulon virgatum]|uniref:Uncharacterized protein n=1 Tax=Stereocaulon virgatum TaxID=373712 RepID=A0ABR4ADF2_9LECA
MQVSIIISLFSSPLLAPATPAPSLPPPASVPVSGPLPTNAPIGPIPPIAPSPLSAPVPTGLPNTVPPLNSGIAVPPVTGVTIPPAVSSIIASVIGGGGGGLPSVPIPPMTNLVPTGTGVPMSIPSSVTNSVSIAELLQIALELIQDAVDLLPVTGASVPLNGVPLVPSGSGVGFGVNGDKIIEILGAVADVLDVLVPKTPTCPGLRK